MNTDPLAQNPESFASALAPEEIKRELARNMVQQMGRDPSFATKQDWFYALAYFLRGRLSASRVQTWRRNFANHAKWVYYFSLELLPALAGQRIKFRVPPKFGRFPLRGDPALLVQPVQGRIQRSLLHRQHIV